MAENHPITQAMILSAGLGTRLKPWTDHHPKALALVNGRTLLEHNVRYLQRAGIYEVVVNIHHFADQITDAIEAAGGWGSRITISDERDEVLETGGGLKKAASFFREGNFVLMNVDILTDLDLEAMIGTHLQHAPLATLAVRNRDTSRYFLFNEEGLLAGWKNMKTGEQKLVRQEEPLHPRAFSGIHVISTQLLSLMRQQGKFSMVDVYLDLAKENPIRAFDHTSSRFLDVGTQASIEMAGHMF